MEVGSCNQVAVTHYCQVCRAKLVITSQSEPDSARPQLLFDASRIDESFIVLDDKRPVAYPGHGPPGRGLEESFVLLPTGTGGTAAAGARGALFGNSSAGRSATPTSLGALQAGRMGPGGAPSLAATSPSVPIAGGGDGVYSPGVMSAGTSASTAAGAAGGGVLRGSSGDGVGAGGGDGGVAQGGGTPGGGEGSPVGAPGLDAKLEALQQLFDLAASDMQVDHPLCLDCASQLKDEMEAQIREAEQEIAAYVSAAASLEADQSQQALPEETFQAQLADLAKDKQAAEAAAAKAESDLAALRLELAGLEAAAENLDELEDKYWHDYNEFQASLAAHVEERDALVSRTAAINQRKQLLQATNVYNDAFKIWHDGAFATISGFKLGRTSEVAVEWDEVNAAWGQAVLLLHTMSQSCGIILTSGQLIPMGSHPRVKDKKGVVYDLFGPVNKLWSSNYDRAMVTFLSCLQEFGEKAAQKDPPFEGFPFPIDNDKVNGHTIKLTFNKDSKWTKALKFMLANLKRALSWMVKYETVKREEASQQRLAALGQERLMPV